MRTLQQPLTLAPSPWTNPFGCFVDEKVTHPSATELLPPYACTKPLRNVSGQTADDFADAFWGCAHTSHGVAHGVCPRSVHVTTLGHEPICSRILCHTGNCGASSKPGRTTLRERYSMHLRASRWTHIGSCLSRSNRAAVQGQPSPGRPLTPHPATL